MMMFPETTVGHWIVHSNGGLTHIACNYRHDSHRDDLHFCGNPGDFPNPIPIPIIVRELLIISRSMNSEYWPKPRRGF